MDDSTAVKVGFDEDVAVTFTVESLFLFVTES